MDLSDLQAVLVAEFNIARSAPTVASVACEAPVADLEIARSPAKTKPEVAPCIPFYWGDLQRTTYEKPDPLPIIHKQLTDAFTLHNIIWGPSEDTRCGYFCTVEHLGAYLEVNTAIFQKGDNHVVEFQHLSGCRFSYGNLMDKLATTLHVKFPGKTLPMSPPPFPKHLATPMSIAKNIESCKFVLSLISKGSGFDMVLQGLRSAGNVAMDKDRACLFAPGNVGVDLAVRTAEIFINDQGGYDETRIIAMYAIAKLIRVDGACPSMVEALTNAATQGREDINPHVRRLAGSCF